MLPNEGPNDSISVDDKKVLLTVGSHNLIKGIPLLVQASRNVLSQDSRVSHVFVGSGPFSNMVENLASARAVDGPILHQIHTSCSQPLDVGDTYGDLEVTTLEKICVHETPKPPKPPKAKKM